MASLQLRFDGAAGEGRWEYLWQTQLFSCAACPERWRWPLALALSLRALAAPAAPPAAEPAGASLAARAAAAGGGRRTRLPTGNDPVAACWESYGSESWRALFLPSQPFLPPCAHPLRTAVQRRRGD